jgi:hypothetical protein
LKKLKGSFFQIEQGKPRPNPANERAVFEAGHIIGPVVVSMNDKPRPHRQSEIIQNEKPVRMSGGGYVAYKNIRSMPRELLDVFREDRNQG